MLWGFSLLLFGHLKYVDFSLVFFFPVSTLVNEWKFEVFVTVHTEALLLCWNMKDYHSLG